MVGIIYPNKDRSLLREALNALYKPICKYCYIKELCYEKFT